MREPIWLSRAILKVAHRDQIREHGGLPGLRDEGLLESALARPRNRWGLDSEADLPALAASYGFGLARNHPFLDGNKRMAFVAMNTFLLLNGLEIEAPEEEVVAVILGLARGTLEEPALAEWVRAVVAPHDL